MKRTTTQKLRADIERLRQPPGRRHRLHAAEARIENAHGRLRMARSSLEKVDAVLELRSALAAARRLLADDVDLFRSRRSGLALRGEYRGRSERRLPIGRDHEKRGSRQGLEVRSSGAGHQVEVTGAACRYGVPYTVEDAWGCFSERMMAGVASGVLGRDDLDVRFLFGHDGLPLARTTSGTLTLTDTRDALLFSATLDTRMSAARDLLIAVERSDVSQCSIGFCVAEDTWSEDYTSRTVTAWADLFDVSAVSFAASPSTHLSVVGSGVGA